MYFYIFPFLEGFLEATAPCVCFDVKYFVLPLLSQKNTIVVFLGVWIKTNCLFLP